MNYKRLKEINKLITECSFLYQTKKPCKGICNFKPVVNYLSRKQKYLLISSDPSSFTDKDKNTLDQHSDFELRTMSLFFTGNDNKNSCQIIKNNFQNFKKIFLEYFYWTHYAKCYSKGSPNNFCANQFLQAEIVAFKPKLIIIFGEKPFKYLFPDKQYRENISKIIYYRKISVIVSMHPSRNWNLQRRNEYNFDSTWKIIRKNIIFSKHDILTLNKLLNFKNE